MFFEIGEMREGEGIPFFFFLFFFLLLKKPLFFFKKKEKMGREEKVKYLLNINFTPNDVDLFDEVNVNVNVAINILMHAY